MDDPVATEVTRPSETVARLSSDESQETVAADITVPPASSTVAVKVAVLSNEANVRLVGESVTLAAI